MENSVFVGKMVQTPVCIAELYGFHDDVTTPRKGDTSLAVRLKLVFNTFLDLAWLEGNYGITKIPLK